MGKTKQLVEERPEDLARQVHQPQRQTRDGREIPSSVPLEPPLGYKRQPTLAETMRNMIRSEALERHARSQGQETFEEADDFDIEDEDHPDRNSPYEANFDPIGEADRRALRGDRIPDDDPQLQELTRQRPTSQQTPKSQDPVEGGAEPSPEPGSDPPAGGNPLTRVAEHFRRKPSK